MAYLPDFSLFEETFTYAYVLGVEWIIPLMITIVGMLIITRDINKWKIMALPMLILTRIAGIPTNIILLMVAGIIFVIEALSTQTVGNILQSVYKGESIMAGKREKKEISDLAKRVKKLKLQAQKESYAKWGVNPKPESKIKWSIFK